MSVPFIWAWLPASVQSELRQLRQSDIRRPSYMHIGRWNSSHLVLLVFNWKVTTVNIACILLFYAVYNILHLIYIYIFPILHIGYVMPCFVANHMTWPFLKGRMMWSGGGGEGAEVPDQRTSKSHDSNFDIYVWVSTATSATLKEQRGNMQQALPRQVSMLACALPRANGLEVYSSVPGSSRS